MTTSYINESHHVRALQQDNPESDTDLQEYYNMVIESIYYSELAITYDNEREAHA